MREIKFRAWDETNRCIGFVTNITYIAETTSHIFPLGNPRSIEPPELIVSVRVEALSETGRFSFQAELTDNTCLQQFTGIHDKNGKEIYEGDIISHDDNGVPRTFRVDIPDIYRGNFPIFATFGTIIGNVYENPELLK